MRTWFGPPRCDVARSKVRRRVRDRQQRVLRGVAERSRTRSRTQTGGPFSGGPLKMVVSGSRVTRLGVGVAERVQTFEPFVRERAYIRLNEMLVDRMLKRCAPSSGYRVLDVAAGTGLMTQLVRRRARAAGARVDALVVDLDPFALQVARSEAPPDAEASYVCASADRLPFPEHFDMAIFANSLHLFDDRAKVASLAAVRAISGYRDFAMGALRASEADAEQASRALQSTVQQAFRDLHMKYLPRNWLEIIAVRS